MLLTRVPWSVRSFAPAGTLREIIDEERGESFHRRTGSVSQCLHDLSDLHEIDGGGFLRNARLIASFRTHSMKFGLCTYRWVPLIVSLVHVKHGASPSILLS